MALEPTGCLSLPLSYLRSMIANCASFQALVGADDASEALAKIAYGYASDEDDPLTLPRCVVRLAEQSEIIAASTGSDTQTTFMVATFEAAPPIDNEDIVTESDQYLWWTNFMGTVPLEVRAQRFNEGGLDCLIGTSNIGIADSRKENGVDYFIGCLMATNEGLP